jgi:arginine decarboxylase
MTSAELQNSNERVSCSGLALPTAYFLVAGAGDATAALVAFDKALLIAGIGDVNLVKLSSIVPPGAKRIEPFALPAGSLVGVAYANLESGFRGQRIASAVAIAHPEDRSRASVVMEYSGVGSKEDIEAIAVGMAREAMMSRRLTVAAVESIAVEHVVEVVGATFAGIVEIQI